MPAEPASVAATAASASSMPGGVDRAVEDGSSDPVDRLPSTAATTASASSMPGGVDRAAEDGSSDPLDRPPSTAASASSMPGGVERVVEDDPSSPLDHPLIQDLLLDPTRWRLWPAVALLRWMLRGAGSVRRLAYRAHPALSFSPSEVHDIALNPDRLSLTLAAPGLASPGSPLPTSDIERIIHDSQVGAGAMSAFLDGLTDRLMHAVEAAEARSNSAFCLATGGREESTEVTLDLIGRSAPLNLSANGAMGAGDPAQSTAGGVGLGRMFIGTVSAVGLEALATALTGLPARAEEFVPVTLPSTDKARLGRRLGIGTLGATCEVATGGVDVIIDGSDDVGAEAWIDSVRIRSLHTLARAYVGTPVPRVRFFLDMNAARMTPATLNDSATLGRSSLLGAGSGRIRVPLVL